MNNQFAKNRESKEPNLFGVCALGRDQGIIGWGIKTSRPKKWISILNLLLVAMDDTVNIISIP